VSGQHQDDDAWRAIVENYGERPHVDPLPAEPPELTGPLPPAPYDLADDPWPEERFVPPEPPPLPHPPPVRLAAWVGLFGAPAVLLVALVLGIGLPPLLAYGLVGAFLGGFAYLVIHMQRGPRDPGDDGARL
jgi:hypothetical protein